MSIIRSHNIVRATVIQCMTPKPLFGEQRRGVSLVCEATSPHAALRIMCEKIFLAPIAIMHKERAPQVGVAVVQEVHFCVAGGEGGLAQQQQGWIGDGGRDQYTSIT